jgi:hypothetical protein
MSKRRKPPSPERAIEELAREVEALRAKYGIQEEFKSVRRAGTMAPRSQADRFLLRTSGPAAADELAKRHAGGRPPLDPDDVRADRLGLRIHSDLRDELDRLAREEGMRLSMFVERILIDAVNAMVGHRMLDKIGRYMPTAQGSKQR